MSRVASASKVLPFGFLIATLRSYERFRTLLPRKWTAQPLAWLSKGSRWFFAAMLLPWYTQRVSEQCVPPQRNTAIRSPQHMRRTLRNLILLRVNETASISLSLYLAKRLSLRMRFHGDKELCTFYPLDRCLTSKH